MEKRSGDYLTNSRVTPEMNIRIHGLQLKKTTSKL
nr:MAG TPA: hypothetical protein [Caudoviricetes sp.]